MNLREETGKRGGLVVLSFNVSLMHDNISYDNIHSKLINAYPIILFGKKNKKKLNKLYKITVGQKATLTIILLINSCCNQVILEILILFIYMISLSLSLFFKPLPFRSLYIIFISNFSYLSHYPLYTPDTILQ